MYWDLENSLYKKCIGEMSTDCKKRLNEYFTKWQNKLDKYKNNNLYETPLKYDEYQMLNRLGRLLNSEKFYMEKKVSKEVEIYRKTTCNMLHELEKQEDLTNDENYQSILTVFKNIFILIENIYLSPDIVRFTTHSFSMRNINKWSNASGCFKIYDSENGKLTRIYIILTTFYLRIKEIFKENSSEWIGQTDEEFKKNMLNIIEISDLRKIEQKNLIEKNESLYLDCPRKRFDSEEQFHKIYDKLNSAIDEINAKERKTYRIIKKGESTHEKL